LGCKKDSVKILNGRALKKKAKKNVVISTQEDKMPELG